MKHIVALLLLISPVILKSQDQAFNDKLYLHNGSALTGKLIQYNMADTVIFAISESQILRFPGKSVKKVKMASRSSQEQELFRLKTPTWYIRSQVSMLYSKANQGLSMNLSAGYQFNHWLAGGIGGGIDNYYTLEGQNIFPLFSEIRASLLKKNATPYLAMRTGYGFISRNEDNGQSYAKGSWMFNPIVGYRLGAGRPHIDIFVGARFQSARYIFTENLSITERDIDFRRYDIGFGITF